MTAVDRVTRCIVGVAVVWARTTAALQTLLDTSVWAANYFSDAFNLYLTYRGCMRGGIRQWRTKVRPTLWKATTPSCATI
jgi:hypothetical protein